MIRPFPLPALLLLAACRLPLGDGPPPSPDVAAPDAWRAGADAGEVSPDPWWTRFASPGLAAAVEEALVANRDLAVAAARLEAATAQARIAGGERWPRIDANASRVADKRIFVGLPIPGTGNVLESRTTTWGASLDVTWELDLWGRLSAAARAGTADLAASAADLGAARHSIAAQTAKAWFALQEARLQVELAEDTARSFRRSADRIGERFDRGLAPSLDRHLGEANAEEAEARVRERRATLERARRGLELVLGRYPGGEVTAPGNLPPPPPDMPAGLPSGILRRRPDLVAAEARLMAADERLHAARAALFPRISLTGSTGRTSDALGDLTDADFGVGTLAANLTQPIFQGGRLRAGVDLADARVREALADYASGILIAFSEVETALAVEEHLRDLVEHLRRASEEARAARELARERYTSGLSPLIDLLEAQRRALDAESRHLAARRGRLEARIDLHLALGGGFEGQQGDER